VPHRNVRRKNNVEHPDQAQLSMHCLESVVTHEKPITFSHCSELDYRVLVGRRRILDFRCLGCFSVILCAASARRNPSLKRSIVPTGSSAGTSTASEMWECFFVTLFPIQRRLASRR
jgi:hypothetical protein